MATDIKMLPDVITDERFLRKAKKMIKGYSVAHNDVGIVPLGLCVQTDEFHKTESGFVGHFSTNLAGITECFTVTCNSKTCEFYLVAYKASGHSSVLDEKAE